MSVRIEVDADLARFVQRIEGLSAVADGEARKIASALDAGISDGASKVGVSIDRMAEKFGALGTVAERGFRKAGGALGEIGDLIFDFAAPIGSMTSQLGKAGAAATALGVGIVGVGAAAGIAAAAVVGLANAAESARDRLVEQGLAAKIPQESMASLDAYETATSSLKTEVDLLVVSIGEGLAGSLSKVVDELAAGVRGFREFATTAVAVELITPEALTAAREARKEIEAFGPALEAAQADFEVLVTPGVVEMLKAIDKALAGTEKRAEEAAKRAEKAAKELQKLRDNAIDVPPPLKIMSAELDRASSIMLKFGNAANFNFTDAGKQAINASELIKTSVNQMVNNSLDGIESITDAIVASYERRAAAGEELTDKEKAAANRAFIIGKAAAISQITISAVQAWAGMTANMSAYLGPVAPLAAFGVVATSLIAPIAALLGEPIPFAQAPGGMSGSGGDPNIAPTAVGPAPDQGSNYKDPGNPDNKVPVGGGSNRSSKQGQTLTIDLSRAAGQLLKVSAGKSARGRR